MGRLLMSPSVLLLMSTEAAMPRNRTRWGPELVAEFMGFVRARRGVQSSVGCEGFIVQKEDK